MAGTEETGLLPELVDAVPSDTECERLAQGTVESQQQLMQTLLFLGTAGLQRPWELRSYTGDGLALLTGRERAFGYIHTERFLSQLAQADGDEPLTDAVAQWSYELWEPDETMQYYVDMHRKPVYSEDRLPRGRIGRTGQIQECRALALLHDADGHPLLATTSRGDTHLTHAMPELLDRYHTILGDDPVQAVVLDREGLGGDFLYGLQDTCEVTTLLKSNQYDGESTFNEVGEFLPLEYDDDGDVIRDVASARFELNVPGEPDEALDLSVALLRDWTRMEPSDEPVDEADWVSPYDEPQWWESDYVATPLPAPPQQPKLIPIVCTDGCDDAAALVETYKQRWPVQENIIRDFLLPLGLDINHGYAKQPVENSELTKRREKLEQQLANVRRWGAKAHERSERASSLEERRRRTAKDTQREYYQQLGHREIELEEQSLSRHAIRKELAALKAGFDQEIEELWRAQRRAFDKCNDEWNKAERYAHKERKLLRQLEDLEVEAKQMYELDDRKDHIMTTLRVALTNLVMWVRDHFFPDDYDNATWKRLAPFFRLPGYIVETAERCTVYLRRFNDTTLNRDLTELCRTVTGKQLQLPDGRVLQFKMSEGSVQFPDISIVAVD